MPTTFWYSEFSRQAESTSKKKLVFQGPGKILKNFRVYTIFMTAFPWQHGKIHADEDGNDTKQRIKMKTFATLESAREFAATNDAVAYVLEIDHRDAGRCYICAKTSMHSLQWQLDRQPMSEIVRLVAEHEATIEVDDNSLIAQRGRLTDALAACERGAFPGSAESHKEAAALKALSGFDAAHPEVIKEINRLQSERISREVGSGTDGW